MHNTAVPNDSEKGGFCFLFLCFLKASLRQRRISASRRARPACMLGLLWWIIDPSLLFPIWVIVSVAASAL